MNPADNIAHPLISHFVPFQCSASVLTVVLAARSPVARQLLALAQATPKSRLAVAAATPSSTCEVVAADAGTPAPASGSHSAASGSHRLGGAFQCSAGGRVSARVTGRR
jgi:hypothetical protein